MLGLDLVNLFPVKLDLKPFIDAWGNGARFVLWSPAGNALRFCGLNAHPSGAWAFQTNDVYTTAGGPAHPADLVPVGGEGVEIDPDDYLGSGGSPGVLAFEAADAVSRSDALVLLVIGTYVQYSWHHQELWKGRGIANVLGATTWSGWNIEENVFGRNKISVEEAQGMLDEDFMTNTVFYCYPSSMNSTNISLLVRGAHLVMGIPALTPPTGRIAFGGVPMLDLMINVNANSGVGIDRPNGWPARSRWGDRWLHSDMKDISYFFNYKFYDKAVEKGNLK